jgi:hypothetical protein
MFDYIKTSINHACVYMSSQTPLKAKRFERDDAFFASFFSKKNDERNKATIEIRGKSKKVTNLKGALANTLYTGNSQL